MDQDLQGAGTIWLRQYKDVIYNTLEVQGTILMKVGPQDFGNIGNEDAENIGTKIRHLKHIVFEKKLGPDL